ncbi:MAG: DNA repair protein RecN, partial [Bacteroidales bacterium]|nr:DNA repair protein RecN [Bacteroidales bacterium]
MLSHLSISNYVLIEKLDIDFQSGFSVITGETGAGKSIMLGALGLVLGDRADKEALYKDSKKCIIEGHFSVDDLKLQSIFHKYDIDYESICIVRREITAAGKNRAFINDTPVKLPILKDIGSYLIDIHSQNQNQQLNNAQFRLSILDAYASHDDLLKTYKKDFEIYKRAEESLMLLKETLIKQQNEKEYHQFLYDEIEKVNIQKGEQKQLEEELQILNHAEEIKLNLFHTAQEIVDSDENIISKLQNVSTKLNAISSYQDTFKDLEVRLDSVIVELQDIGELSHALEGDIHFDAARLQFVDERLSTLYSLVTKHKFQDAEELLALQLELEQKLFTVSDIEEEIKQKDLWLVEQRLNLISKANKISDNRKKASKKIVKLVLDNLKELGMPKANFEIVFNDLETLSKNGKDRIVFMFKANVGSQMSEISKVASGGELSRIMLSFKYVLALKKAIPTIVFDEIDTGVSGEVSDKLASLMRSLSKHIQVISISHLAQIASKADIHYLVYKENGVNFTRSNIKKLNDH